MHFMSMYREHIKIKGLQGMNSAKIIRIRCRHQFYTRAYFCTILYIQKVKCEV